MMIKYQISTRIIGILAGLALIVIGFAADALGLGGRSGLEAKQWALIVAGVGWVGFSLAPRPRGSRAGLTYFGLMILVAILIATLLGRGFQLISPANVSAMWVAWLAAVCFVTLVRFRSRLLLAATSILFTILAVELVLIGLEISESPPAPFSSPVVNAEPVQGERKPQKSSQYRKPGVDYSYQYSVNFQLRDPRLHIRLIPSVRSVNSKWFDEGDFIFKDVVYTIDDRGRRLSVSEADEATTPTKHALFFGGSFTFGMGVEDEETLPSQLERVAGGEFQSFNFGVGGYGMGQYTGTAKSWSGTGGKFC